jgi:cytochrome c oxidase subunit 2
MKFWLPAAAADSIEVDHLFEALLAISAAVLALVFGLMLLFVVRYRADSGVDRGQVGEKSWRFEIAWIGATLVMFFGLFLWGADLYIRLDHAPVGALKIYVVAKQWMWKVEHPGGQREIDALHVPAGHPVELVMTSEDVIHDFSVPAFRVKRDVLPGRYETLWFKAVLPGTYHLFCTQFCGLDHAAMTGDVIVMTEPDYAAWLGAQEPSGSLAASGRQLFIRYGCDGCHEGRSTVRAPSLSGLYGAPVPLADGSVVTANDRYLHDSIVQPGREVVAGYAPVMPSYARQIGESDLIQLIAYIKSLADQRKEMP